MTRRILVLFPDEWDREAARDPRYRGRFEFVFAGFDLFSFPGNARLFTFDALRFAQVMRAHAELREDPFSMVCEGIVRGRQVTANGFARRGRVTLLGIVDSVMYPGTDHFQRFQYPSTLSPEQLAAVDRLAVRLIEGLGSGSAPSRRCRPCTWERSPCCGAGRAPSATRRASCCAISAASARPRSRGWRSSRAPATTDAPGAAQRAVSQASS